MSSLHRSPKIFSTTATSLVDLEMSRAVVVLFLVLTAFHVSVHSAPPLPATEYLEAHNAARAEVGVPPLKWSDLLANSTARIALYQRVKMGCNFANLTSGKYGGNQLFAGGQTITPRMAVETWVKEKLFYNYGDNTCAQGHRCGVYTQVVWRNSSELGCAQAVCSKGQTSLTICLYSPPGNVVGEKPY